MYTYKNNNENVLFFKKRNLPTDYQTGSCHGGKRKDDEGEHKGKIKK